MKKYIKLIVLGAAAAAALTSCVFDGGKAEFTTSAYACFNGTRLNVKETVGQVAIPVVLHSPSTKNTIITYKVTPDTAVEGEDYTLVNKSGTLSITSDPSASKDSIRINIISHEGIKTGNKKFKIELMTIGDDTIDIGPTTAMDVTILDNEGGLASLIGSWSGSSDDTSEGTTTTWTWEIEGYTPTADDDYPDANCRILEGFTIVDPMSNAWNGAVNLYCHFNDDTYELSIYTPQIFAGANFGGNIGVLYISLAPVSFLKSGTLESVKMLLGEDELILQNGPIYFGLFKDVEGTDFSGYTCGYVNTITMVKK